MSDRNIMAKDVYEIIDDTRFRIKPYQQIASSCFGAVLTSLSSKIFFCFSYFFSRSCKILNYYEIPLYFNLH